MNRVIYMHRITDIRIGGTARKNFEVFKQLCGANNFTNIAIVTNMWNMVSEGRGAAREFELKQDPLFFRMPLEQGAAMFRHDNTAKNAQNAISYLIKKRPFLLRIQRELVDEKKDISETAAAIVVQGEIATVTRKHEKELEEIREDMNRALGANDWMARRELEEAQRDLEQRIHELRNGQARLPSDFAQAKAQAAEELQRVSALYVMETQWRGSESPLTEAQSPLTLRPYDSPTASHKTYNAYPSSAHLPTPSKDQEPRKTCCVIM